MKILIIGGTGFIGSSLVSQLSDHKLTLLHRGNNSDAVKLEGGIQQIIVDRSNIASVKDQIRIDQYDVAVDMISSTEDDALQVIKVLEGAVENVVAISSGSVYKSFGCFLRTEPDEVQESPSTEDSPLRKNLYPYARQFPRFENDPKGWLAGYDKIPMEMAYRSSDKLNASIVRLPLVFGPGDRDERVQFYVREMNKHSKIFIDKVAANWKNARLYVENVALALKLVVENAHLAEVYNVSSEDDLTEMEWLECIGKVVGWKGELILASDTQVGIKPLIDEFPDNANYEQHLRLDSTKIRTKLGYKEKTAVLSALERTIKDGN